MNAKSITITLSDEEALSVRIALNLTACEWGDKALAHIQAGESDDADTCQRLRAKYHELWERVHGAQRLAEAEAADDMFASEAREATRPGDRAVAQWFADDARETARVAAECDALEADIPW